MLDRNPVSPTFGCFDREYWHYRTVDFPCGMNQEMCLALAMAWSTNHPANPYSQNVRLRELILGSLHYARSSAYGDGTCDDYYPGEKALGALVFTLYAMTESYLTVQANDAELLEFFARRGSWLLDHNESGQLSNHQALAALGLQNVFQLTGERRFETGMRRYRDRTLSWQHSEGWFQEYEGADPGYHSCTIDFLAKLRSKTSDDLLTKPLIAAARFAAHFAHPDGSYAGEYGSRNTYHFYPHGFELLASESADALGICELYLRKGLPLGTRYFNDDNRMCAHYVYDWLQAWRDYAELPERGGELAPLRPGLTYFEGAGLLVQRQPSACIVVAARKGAVVKAVGSAGPIYSDTGPMVQFEDGRVLVSHLVSEKNEIRWEEGTSTLTVSGRLCRRRAPIMTPLKQIVFRILSIALGYVNPNWLRILVQRLFITGKPATECRFERAVQLREGGLTICDRIELVGERAAIRAVLAAPDATSIYVANSNTYQATNLLPVRRLNKILEEIRKGQVGAESVEVSVPSEAAAAIGR
jgi:hypothetical protein